MDWRTKISENMYPRYRNSGTSGNGHTKTATVSDKIAVVLAISVNAMFPPSLSSAAMMQ